MGRSAKVGNQIKKGVCLAVQPPFLVSYSITRKCNLKCKHCYSDSSGEALSGELSTEEAFRLVEQLAAWGVGLLVIDGGEPLCREDLLAVVRRAASCGLRTTLGSNGTLLDKSVAKKLKEAGLAAVAISLDGAEAATHGCFPRGERGLCAGAQGGGGLPGGGAPFPI